MWEGVYIGEGMKEVERVEECRRDEVFGGGEGGGIVWRGRGLSGGLLEGREMCG